MIEKKQSKNTMQYGLDTAIRTQTQNPTLFYAEIVTAFKSNFSSTHSIKTYTEYVMGFFSSKIFTKFLM
jgi:hypothetical protein